MDLKQRIIIVPLCCLLLFVCFCGAITGGCSSDEFPCNQTHCIPVSWQCDGIGDCEGAIDENNCTVDSKSSLLFVADMNTSTIYMGTTRIAKLIPLNISVIGNPVAIDYDPVEQRVYWTDVHHKFIGAVNIDGSNQQLIITGLWRPDGMVVDSQTRTVFWTDADNNTIEAIYMNGTNHRVILGNVDKPRAIIILPSTRMMYWTTWGAFPRIEMADLNGRNRQVIVDTRLFWPNGLTHNDAGSRIYWVDAFLDKLETSDIYGRDRKIILHVDSKKFNIHPFGVMWHRNTLLWTDWNLGGIGAFNADWSNWREGFALIIDTLRMPTDLKVYDDYSDKCGEGGIYNPVEDKCICSLNSETCEADFDECSSNPCQNGGTCTDGMGTYSCKCLDGYSGLNCIYDVCLRNEMSCNWTHCIPLSWWCDGIEDCDHAQDETNCQATSHSKKSLLFITHVDGGTIYMGTTDENVSPLNISDVYKPAAIDYDPVEQTIFWTDLTLHSIEAATIDGSKRRTILAGLKASESMVLDGKTQTIFFTDTMNHTIEAVHVNGNHHRFIISNLDKPLAIVILPTNRMMYWTSLGAFPKIERADLNGEHRRVIVDKDIRKPFGLAHNAAGTRLFWCDGYLDKIETSDINGGDRRVLLDSSSIVHTPYSIVWHRNFLLWTQWRYSAIGVFKGEHSEWPKGYALPLGLKKPARIKVYDDYSDICHENATYNPVEDRCICQLGFPDDGCQTEFKVETEPTALVQKRRNGNVTCKVPTKKKLQSIAWTKGLNLFSAENIVFQEFINGEKEKKGPGYDNGQFDISDDYSLIIHNVKIQDQGRYYCNVALEDGNLYRNYTDVSVVAPPTRPFPVVQGCLLTDSDGAEESNCIIVASSDLNVTCSVLKYFPAVSLEFRQDLIVITPAEMKEWKNVDGTFSKSITVTVSPSDEPYNCIASNISGYSHDLESSILVYITSHISPTDLSETTNVSDNILVHKIRQRYVSQPTQFIETEPTTLLQKGRNETLTCKVPASKKLMFLAWNKGSDVLSAENIVFLDLSKRQKRTSGPEYDNGHFDISEDYSLIIHDVKIQDQGRYYCEVAVVNDYLYRNYTDVSVFAPPTRPFPVVQGCRLTDTDGVEESNCFIVASSDLNVTCSVLKYFPAESLEFRQDLIVITPAEMREWKNDDGTFSKSITVTVSPSDEPYRCIASNISGYISSSSILVYVTSNNLPTDLSETTNVSNKFMLSFSLAALCALFFISILSRIRHPKILIQVFSSWVTRSYNRTALSAEEQESIVPDEGITDYIDELAQRLIGRHCRRIFHVLKASAAVVIDRHITSIIKESNDVIFDARRMLNDWLDDQDCSDKEKRSRLRGAELLARGKDPTDYNWICDEELKQIEKLIFPSMRQTLLQKLHITVDATDSCFDTLRKWRDYGRYNPASEDTTRRNELYSSLRELHFTSTVIVDGELLNVCNEVKPEHHSQLRQDLGIHPEITSKHGGNLLEELREWRVRKTSLKEEWKKRTSLLRALTKLGYNSNLQHIKEKYVSKSDLVDQANLLCMADIRPFAECLGIGKDQLNKYRYEFHPSHLKKGTYYLLPQLRVLAYTPQTDERSLISMHLTNMGYVGVARKHHIGEYRDLDTSSDNIRSMLTKMGDQEIELLHDLLLSEHIIQTDLPPGEMRQRIPEEVVHWVTAQFDGVSGPYDDIVIKIRDVSDRLVENGFCSLAQEVLIIGKQFTRRLM